MDHDRLFKELIANFFIEFVELFLPDVNAFLDKEAAIFPLDKEVFTDVTAGEKHEADLIMRVKFRGQDAFFLIHVEAQASAQSTFPKRMFRYFARLDEKYDLPVYPVVIFSYDKPHRPEPAHYEVAFPGKHEGKEDLLTRQIRKRFGSLSPELAERIDALSSDQLNDLGEALLDFASVVDLETWLARHNPH